MNVLRPVLILRIYRIWSNDHHEQLNPLRAAFMQMTVSTLFSLECSVEVSSGRRDIMQIQLYEVSALNPSS